MLLEHYTAPEALPQAAAASPQSRP